MARSRVARRSMVSRLRSAWNQRRPSTGRLSAVARRGAIEGLEDRITPVVGAFDVPAAISTGWGYDGVARVGLATGTLLNTARHILTAAHVGDQGTGLGSGDPARFRVLDANFDAKSISTPPRERIPHPDYDTNAQNRDISVTTLAELAPLNAERWEIYTDDDEVGQVGQMVGYGATGTGVSGLATDIKSGQYHATDVGSGTNYELARITISGNPTGGQFIPRLTGEIPDVLGALPYNVTAPQLEMALEGIIGGDVQVRLVGDTDFDGDVDDFAHPYAGSFEALFLGASFNAPDETNTHDMPHLTATDTFTGGNNPSVVIETILDGGSPREKRSGYNRVGDLSADESRILADFDDGTDAADTLDANLGLGAIESYGSFGDSGSALFIDGKIAGVLDFLSAEPGEDGVAANCSFGEIESWARVSYHQNFINDILDDPFDLVLNMTNQPWGDDGNDDTIDVTRLGNTLRISINGALRYSENINLIESVTILGSSDDETITVGALGTNDPVAVDGNEGEDVLRLVGLATGATATLNGGDDDDVIHVGLGDFDDRIRGDVTVIGGADDDTLLIDDQEDTNDNLGLPDIYNIAASTFSKPNFWGAVVTWGSSTELMRVDANAEANVIYVDSTAYGRGAQVFGNGGDDVFAVGGNNFAVGIQGALLTHGGFGDDRVVLNNTGSTANDGHTFTATTYKTDLAVATLTFEFMQEVALTAGTGNDTVSIVGTSEDVDLTINTGNGVDTVLVQAVDAMSTVDISTGAHSDTVELSPVQHNLDPIDGAVNVDMGTGASDDLRIHDESGAFLFSGAAYTINSATFDATGFGSLSYLLTENVTLWTDELANTVNVNSLAANVDLSVRTLGGDDLLKVGVGDLDSTVLGDVSFQGGTGEDTFRFNDGSDDFGDDSYTLGNGTFTKTGIESWSYIQTENVQLNASPFDNTIQITSLGPVDLTINAYLGNDTIQFGTTRADLISGDVVVNGSLGEDVIHVNATGTPGGHAYTLAGQSFDMSGALFGSLNYTSIARLQLHAGASNDTIDVQSSVIGTEIGISAGGGNDTIQVGAGDLDSIGGDVTVDGEAGAADAVNVNDQNDLGNDVYSVTASMISKPGFFLALSTVESVTLNAGADANTVLVGSTGLNRPLAINAGAGNDVVQISSNTLNLNQIVGAVTVNGQAGNDAVVVHDEANLQDAIFDLTRRTLTRASFGGLTFGAIEQLQLNQGQGDDTVNVSEFNQDALFTLLGGAGADTYNVVCRPSRVNTGGRLRIQGGAPGADPGDVLRVTYAGDPLVAHNQWPLDPDAGQIAVEYPAALFDVVYDGIEDVLL